MNWLRLWKRNRRRGLVTTLDVDTAVNVIAIVVDVGGTCFAVLIAGKEDEVHIPIAHTCQYVNGGTGRLVEKKFCLWCCKKNG